MNRSAAWLRQDHADLEVAAVNANADHHKWACFACHQALEKGLKGLHLRHGDQIWGHGLGRCWRALPGAVGSALEAAVSLLRWPEPDLVLRPVTAWPEPVAVGPQHQRLLVWPLAELPLRCDALVLTPAEQR